LNPLERLPHRPPFLMLDRVLLLEPGAWAAAVKNVAYDDAHTAADGGWPSVLLAEMMAQTAGLAAGGGGGNALVAKLDRFRCRGRVAAGDRLLASARVVRRLGASVIVRSSVRVNGRRCAAAEIVLRFV